MSERILVPSWRPNLSSLVHINKKKTLLFLSPPTTPSLSTQICAGPHSHQISGTACQQSSHFVCSEPSVRPPRRNTLRGSTDNQFYPERLKAVEKLSPSLLCTVTARPALTHQGADVWTENKIWLQHKIWRDLTKPASWNYYLTLLRLATATKEAVQLAANSQDLKECCSSFNWGLGCCLSTLEKQCKPQIRCSGSWLTSLWLCQHSSVTARLPSSFSFLKGSLSTSNIPEFS